MPWKRCLAGDLADLTKSPKSQLLLFDSGFTEGQPGVRCLWKGLSVIFVSAAGQSRERGRRWVSVPLAGWSSRKSLRVCLQIRIQQNARASSPAPGSQPTLERTNLLQSQNWQEPQRPTAKDFVAKPANGLGFGAFRVCLYSGRNSSCERTASRSKLHVGGFRQHLHKPTSIRASLWPRVGGGRLTAPPGTRAAKIS